MRQLVHSTSGDNEPAPFYSGRKEAMLKHKKRLRYFDNDCLENFSPLPISLKKFQKRFCFKRKTLDLLINTTLLQFNCHLVPDLFLNIKYEIVFFKNVKHSHLSHLRCPEYQI